MKVHIKKLSFKCIIGILDFERVKKQRVIINCSYEYAFTNDVFVDYSQVASEIEQIMKNKKFLLLETAILYISKKIKKNYKINKVKIEIEKPDILKKCKVSIEN